MKKRTKYIIFFLFIAFTSFEYFFRSQYPFWGLAIITFLISIKRKEPYTYTTNLILFIFLYALINTIQFIILPNYSTNQYIGIFLNIFSLITISRVFKKEFIKIFTTITYWICISSLSIYIISFHPTIYTFLTTQIAPRFVSLNVKEAIMEGGGLNFIIYNFQTTTIQEMVGISRNCGPFWEPGMFAVYICLALFFNLFYLKNKKSYNIIFIMTLASTCSTGGYVTGFIIILSYLLFKQKNIIISTMPSYLRNFGTPVAG